MTQKEFDKGNFKVGQRIVGFYEDVNFGNFKINNVIMARPKKDMIIIQKQKGGWAPTKGEINLYHLSPNKRYRYLMVIGIKKLKRHERKRN